MKLLYLFLGTYFIVTNLLAQENTFELNGSNTHKIIGSLKKSPELYHVTRRMITTAIVDKNEQKTKEYLGLQKKIKQLKSKLNEYHVNKTELMEKECLETRQLSELKDQIASLEKQLKTTRKYKIVANGQKSYTKMSFLLQAIVKDPGVLYGVFTEEKGDYYVMGYDFNKFKRGELLSSTTMAKYAITPKQMSFGKAKKLIRNKATNDYYLVPQDFKTLFAYIKPQIVSVVPKQSGNSLKRVSNNPIKSLSTTRKKLVTNYTYKSRVILNEEFEKTENTLNSYKIAINKSKTLTQKLKDHYKALIDGKMTAKRLEEWKNDISEAEILYNSIAKMTGDSPDNTNQPFNQQIHPEFMDNYADFSKALSSAKRVSGY